MSRKQAASCSESATFQITEHRAPLQTCLSEESWHLCPGKAHAELNNKVMHQCVTELLREHCMVWMSECFYEILGWNTSSNVAVHL